MDVTSSRSAAYRVTGVTSVNNYRIGVSSPTNLLPEASTPARTTRYGYAAPTRRKAAPAYAASHLKQPGAPRLAVSAADEVLPGYLQCVPYARQASGIQLFGDARTWWGQAAGRYSRGNTPRVGAVMAFRPHGKMVLGHVAMVSRVVDSRRVLLRHANWSPINGRRGQVERDVMAVDVSPAGDWSAVRVWFDPIQGLGSTHWPVSGFIYPRGATVPVHGLAASRWTSDPIGAIIAAFSRR
ncbi:CHAP domain-containing protein [Novosphingobium rosa]|uniref:CHAP domain-containing protein n=1 Tax=Novosphingobium rosa TaxID=76978 RepID=UPI000AC6394A|nr:CHAP domain-containing protein [Novosphingobium rosa]